MAESPCRSRSRSTGVFSSLPRRALARASPRRYAHTHAHTHALNKGSEPAEGRKPRTHRSEKRNEGDEQTGEEIEVIGKHDEEVKNAPAMSSPHPLCAVTRAPRGVRGEGRTPPLRHVTYSYGCNQHRYTAKHEEEGRDSGQRQARICRCRGAPRHTGRERAHIRIREGAARRI